jgi:hypothetical protein
LSNARVMIHQPMGGARGQATDIDIQATEILKLRARMNEILASHTGKEVDQIAHDTERDFYLSASEACEYGLVDDVVSHRAIAAAPDVAAKGNGGGAKSGSKSNDARASEGKEKAAPKRKSDRGNVDDSDS